MINMKITVALATFFSLASTVQCQGAAGYGTWVDPSIKAGEVPQLQLFASKEEDQSPE
jgi:hypothetical protein